MALARATIVAHAAAGPAPASRRRTKAGAAAMTPTFYVSQPGFCHAHSSASGQRVLPLLSDLLEAQAQTTRFERLAGRTACLGLATAVAVELLLPSAGGVFGGSNGADLATQAAALGTFMLCCSVGLAARTHGSSPAARHRLLEPVLASLTAQQRSLSGVTQRNVDLALDSVMDAVFTPPFLREHFLPAAEEDQYI